MNRYQIGVSVPILGFCSILLLLVTYTPILWHWYLLCIYACDSFGKFVFVSCFVLKILNAAIFLRHWLLCFWLNIGVINSLHKTIHRYWFSVVAFDRHLSPQWKLIVKDAVSLPHSSITTRHAFSVLQGYSKSVNKLIVKPVESAGAPLLLHLRPSALDPTKLFVNSIYQRLQWNCSPLPTSSFSLSLPIFYFSQETN